MIIITKRRFFLLLVSALAAVYWLFLWLHRDHFTMPNTDIFQYIADGWQYFRFKLPANIHPAPFAPILIVYLSSLGRLISPYPEIASAHLINVTLSALNLILVYLFLKKRSPIIALAITLLLATNQIYILSALNVTNEVIYAFFLTLTLYLYSRQKNDFVYLLCGLLFLIRYESIVVPIAIFLVEVFDQPRTFKLRHAVFAFAPIISWLIILNWHSTGTSVLQNAYLVEIYNGMSRLPNWEPFTSLTDLITFSPTYVASINIISLQALSLLTLLAFLTFKLSHTIKISYLILILHLFFLALFPNYAIRYLVPIIWIFYLLIVNQKSRFLQIIITVFLLSLNFLLMSRPSAYDQPLEKSEYITVANWFNHQPNSAPRKVLIYEPWNLQYFLLKPNVSVEYEASPGVSLNQLIVDCGQNLTCVAQQLSQRYSIDTEIFIVTLSYSSDISRLAGDQFTISSHQANSFQNFPLTTDTAFKKVSELGSDKHRATIYQYFPPKSPGN